jgi:hypothetical protein
MRQKPGGERDDVHSAPVILAHLVVDFVRTLANYAPEMEAERWLT